ncbi:hypothetical protein BGZ76_003580 [Entomortierella beljakovae]|nr:hypothetical protein BGZ76_003580 [Entomortierella beljakovae]
MSEPTSPQSHYNEQSSHLEDWQQTEHNLNSDQSEHTRIHSSNIGETLPIHINPSEQTFPSPSPPNTLSSLEYRQDQSQSFGNNNHATHQSATVSSDDQRTDNGLEFGRQFLSDSHAILSQPSHSVVNRLQGQPSTATSENLRATITTRTRSVSASNINLNSSSLSHPSTIPSAVEQDTSLILDEFSVMPRALPRRRYATRDYSSGSVSSDDWLRHPDVVLFTNTENTATEPETVRGENQLPEHSGSSTAHENQEIIPPPLQPVEPMPEINISLAPTPASISHMIETPYTPMDEHAQAMQSGRIPENRTDLRHNLGHRGDHPVTSTTTTSRLNQPLEITEPAISGPRTEPRILDRSQRLPLTSIQNMNMTETSPESSNIPSVSHPDRLGLLGPLLSGTGATSMAAPDFALGFSLLGSTRPGFDSSILSMASRIRQARLIRILRRINESEAIDYPESQDTRSFPSRLVDRGDPPRSSSLLEGESTYHNQNFVRQQGLSDMTFPRSTVNANASLSLTEILDYNGNSIVWNDDNSASSSSSYSIRSSSIMDNSEIQRLRRRLEHIGRDRGVIRTQGRSRVVSTGTAFEGMEFISEADNLLSRTHRNQSLKASWITNPNGECWSDDDAENSQGQTYGDSEDKEQDSGYMEYSSSVRSGVRHQNDSSNRTESYQTQSRIIGNYVEENARRRRVVSEMSDLLRREQEWERELELYERELAAFRSRILSRGMEPRSRDENDATATSPSHRSRESLERLMHNQINHMESSLQQPTEIIPQNNETIADHVQGLHEYEQGHTDYHVQSSSSFELPSARYLRSRWLQEFPLGNQSTGSRHLSVPYQSTIGTVNRTTFRTSDATGHQIGRVHSPRMQIPRRRLGMGQIFDPQQHREHHAAQNPLTQQQRQQRVLVDDEIGRRSEQNIEFNHSNNAFFVPPPSSEPSAPLQQGEGDGNVIPSRAPHNSNSLGRNNRWNILRASHEGHQHTRLSENSPSVTSQGPTNSRFAITTETNEARTTRIDENDDTNGVSNMPSMSMSMQSSLVGSAGNLSSNVNLSLQELNWQEAQQRARQRISNSLYVDSEGGTLRQEEKWRRGNIEMIGR